MTVHGERLSVEEKDVFAWEAICNWPSFSSIDVVHDGLDFSELTRRFLWDKVGRAIRGKFDPEGLTFEEKLLDSIQASTIKTGRKDTIARPIPDALKSLKDKVDYAYDISRLRVARHVRRKPVLFMPKAYRYLESSAAALIKSHSVIVVADSSLRGYKEALPVPTPPTIKNVKKSAFSWYSE